MANRLVAQAETPDKTQDEIPDKRCPSMDPKTNTPKKDTDAPARRISSSELFEANARRIVIQHNGRDYVLIITKQGKLVLNRMP